jgi:hypothetical protein
VIFKVCRLRESDMKDIRPHNVGALHEMLEAFQVGFLRLRENAQPLASLAPVNFDSTDFLNFHFILV